MLPPSAALCVLGFGETGRVLGTALAARGSAVRAHDAQLDVPATRASMQQRIEAAGVHPAPLADALRGAKLILCTSPHDTRAVREAARLLMPGQIFLDLRSLAAGEKLAHEEEVARRGAHYVDACRRTATATLDLAMPIDLAGACAAELAPALNALGFNTRAVGEKAGFPSERALGDPLPAEAAAGFAIARSQNRRGELP